MGRKERTIEQKKICEKDILDAAERRLFQSGFENTTMEEIAIEANYTKRSLYFYFKSKEEIYLSIITRGFKILNISIEVVNRASVAKGIEKVRKLGEAYYAFYKQYTNYFRLIAEYENREQDFSGDNPIISECYTEGEKSIGMLKTALEEGILDGSIRNGIDVKMMAFLLWGQFNGVISIIAHKKHYIEAYYRKNDEEIMRVLSDIIERILKQ